MRIYRKKLNQMHKEAQADNYYVGTLGPGTTIISPTGCVIKRIFWGGTYVGTLGLYDSATIAGTALSNQIILADLG